MPANGARLIFWPSCVPAVLIFGRIVVFKHCPCGGAVIVRDCTSACGGTGRTVMVEPPLTSPPAMRTDAAIPAAVAFWKIMVTRMWSRVPLPLPTPSTASKALTCRRRPPRYDNKASSSTNSNRQHDGLADNCMQCTYATLIAYTGGYAGCSCNVGPVDAFYSPCASSCRHHLRQPPGQQRSHDHHRAVSTRWDAR